MLTLIWTRLLGLQSNDNGLVGYTRCHLPLTTRAMAKHGLGEWVETLVVPTIPSALNAVSWVRSTLNSDWRVSVPPLATALVTASWNSRASTYEASELLSRLLMPPICWTSAARVGLSCYSV